MDSGYDSGYEKPVKEGDVVEVTIEGTGAKGDGIARINGFVIVVPGGREGETVKVRISRVLRKMAFAELASEDEEASNQEAPVEEAPAQEEYSEEKEEESPTEEESTEEKEEDSEE
jgi:predicted RNA-binding protein with TRAM domain